MGRKLLYYLDGAGGPAPQPPTTEIVYDVSPAAGADDGIVVPVRVEPGIAVPTATWLQTGSHRE
jgi:hypothetical protein